MRAPEPRVIADAISYRSGPGWIVAYVEGRTEPSVCHDIKALGHEAYLPAERVWGVKRGQRVEVSRPYFPGYVFASCDLQRDEWQRICDVDGVIDVLRNNDIPSRVPTAWIEALRYAEQVGELDRTKATPDYFHVGENVFVADGPFAGHRAIIQKFISKIREVRSLPPGRRARILIDFLGRQTEVELPVVALERV